jgi:hypothetical protein
MHIGSPEKHTAINASRVGKEFRGITTLGVAELLKDGLRCPSQLSKRENNRQAPAAVGKPCESTGGRLPLEVRHTSLRGAHKTTHLDIRKAATA